MRRGGRRAGFSPPAIPDGAAGLKPGLQLPLAVAGEAADVEVANGMRIQVLVMNRNHVIWEFWKITCVTKNCSKLLRVAYYTGH